MILTFTDLIMKDFVYQQHPDGSYILDKTGNLVPENGNDVIDTFLYVVGGIYKKVVLANKVNPGRIECNTYLLYEVLTRYSRDIFGQRRLDAKLDYLEKLGSLTPGQRKNLSKYSDYGFKVESYNPYVHRQLANLLYWLSVLKPFAIYPHSNAAIKPLGLAFKFHNEFMSYLLSLALLKPFNKTFVIHRSKGLFSKFLYDLHVRSLSRSSLEFLLVRYIA